MQTSSSRHIIVGVVATLALLAACVSAYAAPLSTQAAAALAEAAAPKPAPRPGISPVLCYYVGMCF